MEQFGLKRMNRREALGTMGLLVVAGCMSDRTTDPGGDGDVDVNMTDQFTFSPTTVTIEAGQTVRWRNVSGVAHTATGDASKAADPSNVELPAGASPWDSGLVPAGGTFSQRFDVAGQYRYVCLPHEGQMQGTIIVTS